MVDFKFAFKCMNREMYSKLITVYTKSKLECASQFLSPHLKMHEDLVEKVKQRAASMAPEIRELNCMGKLVAINLPTLIERRMSGDIITPLKFE